MIKFTEKYLGPFFHGFFQIVRAHLFLRNLILFIIYVSLVFISLFVSYLFYEPYLFIHGEHDFSIQVVTLMFAQIFLIYVFRLHHQMIRYASLHDLVVVLRLVVVSFLLNTGVSLSLFSKSEISLRFLLMNHLFLTAFLGAFRLSFRLYRDYLKGYLTTAQQNPAKAVIIGAGDGGDILYRHLKKQNKKIYDVVGYLDDDPQKLKRNIHQLCVLGRICDLKEIIKKHEIKEVLVAIPSAAPGFIRHIAKLCFEAKVEVRIMPKLSDLLLDKDDQIEIRKIRIEDLLARQPVQIDFVPVQKVYQNKEILVTGAAGSIGEELVRQISSLHPETVYLLDQAESPLYFLFREMQSLYPEIQFIPLLCDIADKEALAQVFQTHKPQIILHAAAYKHVPLLEDNVYQAMTVNVMGTCHLLDFANDIGAERFVFISTDKAVNPTNVLGWSKQMGEIICQHYKKKSKTKIFVVRFGNVIGSQGSVIPLFIKQIRNGGPVTVTHSEVRRYFMTIPEAVQLVLYASIMGSGGEVFVLDMGEQVKIAELAHNMIELFGMQPGTDIPVEITGLRPGEKLYEELYNSDEDVLSTSHEKINIAVSRSEQKDGLVFQINRCLDALCAVALNDKMVQKLRSLVEENQSESVAC